MSKYLFIVINDSKLFKPINSKPMSKNNRGYGNKRALNNIKVRNMKNDLHSLITVQNKSVSIKDKKKV